MRKIVCIIIFLLLFVSFVSCDKNDDSDIRVGVSIAPLREIVDKVSGGTIDSYVLIPPGNSPANYQPTAKEMAKLENLKKVFLIGVSAEKMFESNIKDECKFYLNHFVDKKYKVIEGHVHEEEEIIEENEEHGRDPHIWMSVKRYKYMVELIRDELIKLDENNSEIYNKNAEDFIKELDELDELANEKLNDKNISFLIYHPALSYFADDYGLDMIVIEKDGKEPSIKEMENILNQARDKDIKVIFYQGEFDSSKARVIAEELGIDMVEINILGEDYIKSYIDIINCVEGSNNG